MKKIAISTALKVYINFCPELGLENIPNMELLLEPTIEFFLPNSYGQRKGAVQN